MPANAGEEAEVPPTPKKLKEPLDAPPKEQLTLPGIETPDLSSHLTDDMRDHLTKILTEAFNDKAEKIADDMEPPDYLSENVEEYQESYWNDMGARDRYRWASRSGNLPSYDLEEDPEAPKLAVLPPAETDADLIKLAQSSNPKAIWAIADSPKGKQLLLNSDWNGVLNLKDKESMDRFNAYVGKKKKAA